MLEVDQQSVMRPITTATFRVEDADKVQSVVAEAFSIAIRECGLFTLRWLRTSG